MGSRVAAEALLGLEAAAASGPLNKLGPHEASMKNKRAGHDGQSRERRRTRGRLSYHHIIVQGGGRYRSARAKGIDEA